MHTQSLPYQNNSALLFSHFAHLPQSVFLDSGSDTQHQNRYDIIAAMPRKVIVYDPSQDILTEIETALSELKSKVTIPALAENQSPFTIGAIGYLSYDVGKQWEKISETTIKDIALPKAWVGIYDWSIVIDHFSKKTTLHAIQVKRAQQILALLNVKPAEFEPFALTTPFQSNMSKQYYQAAFDHIKKNIIAGNCYQVNLAIRYTAAFTGSSWHAYQILRTENSAPFSAFFNLPNASILCCSPERFLKIESTQVETKPIKGTAKRFSDVTQDQQSAAALLTSEKDRAENVMIVDLLRNDLSRTCTNVTVQQLCALESYSNVHHLVSTITGKLLPNTSPIAVLKNCFPGGSITGAPKIAAMKIIESVEPHQRSVYCGSIFYADISGNVDSNIVIRTTLCDHNKIYCYAGGGIVYDSNCEKEHEEIEAKIGKILAAFPRKRAM